MALVPLTLESLGDLSGGYAKAIIERELVAAVSDLDDRGEDGKARKVKIEIEFKRLNNGTIETNVVAKSEIPPRRAPSTFGETRKREGRALLMFQDMNPERPDQPTFPALEKDGE